MLSFEDRLAQRVRVLQIIAGVMIASVVIFAAVSVVVISERSPLGVTDAQNAQPILSIIACAVLVSCIPIDRVLRNRMLRGAVERISARREPGADSNDEDELLAMRQTSMITSLALLEGAGNLACIAYLIEGQAMVLVAVGVAFFLMLRQFPTRAGMRAWTERYLAIIQELRALGGP